MARPAQPAPRTYGPTEGDAALGVDAPPEPRPGVPRETPPRPAEGSHWTVPSRQPAPRGRLRRKGLDRLTPVFGTATPPRGVSGLIRRIAYRIPEQRARHWMLLLTADRIDVMEGMLGDVLGRPLRRRGFERAGRALQANPAGVLAGATAASIGAALLLRRALR